MYESCSNRNLFGVVRSRRTARSDTSPPLLSTPVRAHVRAVYSKRSPTSVVVRCHGELHGSNSRMQDARLQSDVTKIIVFREHRTRLPTAFDKTFSTIRSSPLRRFFPSTHPNSRLANALQAQRRNSVKTPSGFAVSWCIAMHRTTPPDASDAIATTTPLPLPPPPRK